VVRRDGGAERIAVRRAPARRGARARGYKPATVAMDMGYDNNRVYAECNERGPCRDHPAA
jgi:hypothetical protein